MPTACAHGDTVSFRILTESRIMLWRHQLLCDRLSRPFTDSTSWNLPPRSGEVRQHRLTSPHTSVKSLHLWRHQQVHGRSTTGEASHYLKKTLLGDLFVMPCVTMESREMMSLSVKNTAVWALEVPLEEMCWFGNQSASARSNIRCFLRHTDNHRRHVSGRRLHAQLSLRNLLKMVFKSWLYHNIIPHSVKILEHSPSPWAQQLPYVTSEGLARSACQYVQPTGDRIIYI